MKQLNYEKEHRKLWNWLADHPEAKKQDYFENWDLVDLPCNLCFACEVAKSTTFGVDILISCSRCPLFLGDECQAGKCCGGLFRDWVCEEQPEKRRKLARQIANLPWKEKKEEELRGER